MKIRNITSILVFILGSLTLLSGSAFSENTLPVEFRGYAEIGNVQLFSLRCTQGRGFAWVAQGQRFFEGHVVHYDPLSQSITFSNQQGTFKIKIFTSHRFPNLVGNQVALDQKQGIQNDGYTSRRYKSRSAGDLADDLTIREDEVKLVIEQLIYANGISSGIESPNANLDNDYQSADNSYLQSTDQVYGPFNPIVGTVLTREEKITKRRVGYVQ